MNKIRLYLRQSWNMIRQDKLFSGIYIAGTGLAIALTMTLFIILFVKFAPVYPEYNRDRMVVTSGVKRESKDTANRNFWIHKSSYRLVEMIRELPSVDAVTGIVLSWDNLKVDVSAGYGSIKATRLFTDADYWRVYDFMFVDGRPYTDADVMSETKVAVVSQSFANMLFLTEDAAGRTFSLSGDEYRVAGVVKDVAASLSKNTAGDVWIPHTLSEDYVSANEGNSLLGNYEVAVTAKSEDETDKVKSEIKEMIHRINAQDKEYNTVILGPDRYWENTFRMSEHLAIDEGMKVYVFVLIAVLVIPALNMGGMISSKMERRRPELGIRKTYGASRGQLLVQILWENMLLTLLGGVVGVILSYVIVLSANEWIVNLLDVSLIVKQDLLSGNLSLEMLFNWPVFALTLVTCLVLNLISSMIPAVMSLRHTIINSLKSKQ